MDALNQKLGYGSWWVHVTISLPCDLVWHTPITSHIAQGLGVACHNHRLGVSC